MIRKRSVVIGGVDTHKDVHVAAVLDEAGKIFDTASFSANAKGYGELLAWLSSFGRRAKVGVEGTGAYGAGLARHLGREGVEVVEVNRPNRQARRRRGKSDTVDAEAAARAALNGEATVVAKARGSPRRVHAGSVGSVQLGSGQPHPGGVADPGPDRDRPRPAGRRSWTPLQR